MIKVLIDTDSCLGKEKIKDYQESSFLSTYIPPHAHFASLFLFRSVSRLTLLALRGGCIKDVAILEIERERAKREVEFCVFALRKTFAEVRDGKDFLINPQMSPLSLSLHFRLFYFSFYGVNLKDRKQIRHLLCSLKQSKCIFRH